MLYHHHYQRHNTSPLTLLHMPTASSTIYNTCTGSRTVTAFTPRTVPEPERRGDLNGDTRANLRASLLALPFEGFARCVSQLLERMGYQEVHPVAERGFARGRSRQGGCDLTAFLPVGPYRRPVAVALKQFDQEPVQQRMVDELRGVCLRSGAAEGVLITTSRLSPAVRTEQIQNSPICPVRLIDGDTLLDLLLRHGIGVRNAAGQSVMDEAFFTPLVAPVSVASSQAEKGTKSRQAIKVVDPWNGGSRRGPGKNLATRADIPAGASRVVVTVTVCGGSSKGPGGMSTD